jgi:hypothetical protein
MDRNLKAPGRSSRGPRCALHSLRSFQCLRRPSSRSVRPLSFPPTVAVACSEHTVPLYTSGTPRSPLLAGVPGTSFAVGPRIAHLFGASGLVGWLVSLATRLTPLAARTGHSARVSGCLAQRCAARALWALTKARAAHSCDVSVGSCVMKNREWSRGCRRGERLRSEYSNV